MTIEPGARSGIVDAGRGGEATGTRSNEMTTDAVSRRDDRTVSPPPQLRAYRLPVDGRELVLFAWDAADHAEPSLDALTTAERDVLARVTRGHSNKAIAQARGVALRTVANQVASLLRKLGASSRLELIHRYARR
jgi:DNA-binding NarL/FixJ family response regulator